MLRLELPGTRPRRRPEEIYGCSDRGHEVSWCEKRMQRIALEEADDSLWRHLKGTAERKEYTTFSY